MEEETLGSDMYRPHMEADSQSFDETVRTVELPNINQCEPIHEMDDSQLVGVPVVLTRDSVVGGKYTASTVDLEMKAEVRVIEKGNGKRKRGRPPRGQAKLPVLKKKKKEEEDVCFICFDGGSLVLCDRRGCPKAYHPACIKRDEAFFRSKARWNCGWHICSTCQKAAHYMCYTCTYSLCKACTKDADFLCVRGDKGFCTTCMRTVMLIENNVQENQEMVQVDFDDKSNWEYLFKVYWIYLKGKLSLTLTELAQAKNPWKEIGTMACKGQSPGVNCGTNDCKSFMSDGNFGCLEASSFNKRNIKEQLKMLNKDSLGMEKPGSDKGTSLIGCMEWATKELLEFVAHMKNGDTSVLSQFDVQALLLEYITRNNLRDPHRKSQIICDLMLKNLFGKSRVGHFEMLKLLEFHFLIKEDPRKDVLTQPGIVDSVTNQVKADGNNDNIVIMGKDKKRRRKGDERAPQTNLDEYAAIDVHNINLIYLRRSLMESLIEDNEKFNDKVVGSIVRIRISSSDQKQDMYRLVQVVGTTKVAVPNKVGNMTADVMLEVLNLDKKEAISIDALSNQEFSEDECRRLRQIIRCGLVKRPTVGELQEKAMSLQAVRLNDWLETEISRLNHLRDRASEKGRTKELRECVEKLQLLKTPVERQRRLLEIPEVHSDPKMGQNYESEEDAGELKHKKQGENMRPRRSGFSRKGGKLISPQKRGEVSNGTGRALKNSTSCVRSRNMSTTFYPDKGNVTTKALGMVNEGKDACGLNISGRTGNVDSIGSAIGGWNNQTVVNSASFAGIASETSSAPLSMVNTPSANKGEAENLWHYRDPFGKIQGPFSMVQLQKWSTTGYFPPDMRIWASDRQDDSLLLTDALNGLFHKALPLQSQEIGGASDSNSVLVQDSDILDLPSPTPKMSKEQEGQTAENKQSVPSNFPVQDSGPSWSSASSLVVGGAQLTEITNEWDRYSPAPVKPSVEEWDSGLVCVASLKPPAAVSDSVATPTSNNDPASNASSWQVVGDLIELSTLAEESVSDLLAEVDAMESQSGLASPTSVMNYGGDLIHGPKNDSFSSFEEFSPTPDPGKSDAWSSSGDIQLPCQSTTTDEPVGISQADVFDPVKGSSGQSSTSAVVDRETKSTDVPINQGEADIQALALFTVSRDMIDTDIAQRTGSEMVTSWETMQQSSTTTRAEGETKSTEVPGNLEGSDTLPPTAFATKPDMVDTDIARRAGLEAMDTDQGTMQQSSSRAEVEGEKKSTYVADNQEGSNIPPPEAFTMKQDIVDTDIARRAGLEAVDTGRGTIQRSSTRANMEGETKSADVPVRHEEAGSSNHPPAPFTLSRDMVDTGIDRRTSGEAMDSGWGTVQGNVNLGWGRSAQGITNVGRGTGQGIARGNANVNRGALAGSRGWENQRKYGGERFLTGQRDRAFQGGDSGVSRGKSSWSRQSFGSSGGGGYSRPPPKGQRVCKFYESGRCKKGALCDYLHP